LCALKVEDLNFDYRVLRIRRSVWKGELQTTKSKNGVRTFAIPMQLCEYLKTYLLNYRRDNPEGTREGTPYNNRDIVDQVLHPILERLGIARAGLTRIRHGNATMMDGLNAPMRVRQDRLGHEKAETTLGYTHAIGGDDRRVADKIGEILCPTLPKSPEVA
jgi:integrase